MADVLAAPQHIRADASLRTLGLVSTAHFPAWRRAMLDYQHRHKGWTKFLKRHPSLLRAAEVAIRERGPLGNADFQRTRRNQPSGWWSSSAKPSRCF